MNSEYKQLEKENEKLRGEINKIIDSSDMCEDDKDDLWIKIVSLIDVEIEMEKFCGE